MTEAPDLREQGDCPSAEVCGALCDQHDCGHHPEWFDDASTCHHPECAQRDAAMRAQPEETTK